MAMVASIAGCSFVGGTQGDPSAPVLVAGRVLDSDGRPVAGAELQLVVLDPGARVVTKVGERVPEVFRRNFIAGADGSFAIHLAPTQELATAAAANGGFVNFQIIAVAGDELIGTWAFSRLLGESDWADDPGIIEFQAPRLVVPDVPGLVVPQPAAS